MQMSAEWVMMIFLAPTEALSLQIFHRSINRMLPSWLLKGLLEDWLHEKDALQWKCIRLRTFLNSMYYKKQLPIKKKKKEMRVVLWTILYIM